MRGPRIWYNPIFLCRSRQHGFEGQVGVNVAAWEERIRSQGWAVIPAVIPADRVEMVRERVLAAVDRYRHTRKGAPAQIGAVSGLINYEQAFAPYLADGRLLALGESLLGRNLRISYTSSIVNYPGNERGPWHADWPFNQHNAGHVRAPYPDVVFHLTSLWMLSPFTESNGGTRIVPGSHKRSNNPSGHTVEQEWADQAEEICVTGEAGSVLLMDSRLWHATSGNRTSEPRVGLAVRYAPWWLNLQVLRPGSEERKRMVDEPGLKENQVPPVPSAVFAKLPPRVKPLFRHWLKDQRVQGSGSSEIKTVC